MTTTTKHGTASTKPYLLRAIYQWTIDHQLTPQVMVDAHVDEVVVPLDFVQDGRIVLTIHPSSVKGLEMGNQYLRFSARFAGKPFAVCVPVAAVTAIYCRENGQGMVFHIASNVVSPPNSDERKSAVKRVASRTKKSKKLAASHLTLVK